MIKEISNTSFLNKTINLYRDFWDKRWQGHENKQTCNFDGSMQDLRMLDYCEYELGHPDDSYKSASIIWANVIQKNTDLIWGEENGELYLFTGDSEFPRFNVNIHRFVMNIINSDISQFHSFPVLTEKLLINMLMSEYQIENLDKLKSIVFQYTNECSASFSESFIYAVGEIYKDHKQNLKELHGVLDGNI